VNFLDVIFRDVQRNIGNYVTLFMCFLISFLYKHVLNFNRISSGQNKCFQFQPILFNTYGMLTPKVLLKYTEVISKITFRQWYWWH